MDIDDQLDHAAMNFVTEMIPDGAIPVGIISVVSFMTAEGNDCFRVYCNSELPCSANMGLLEMAKIQVYRNSDTDDEED